MLNIVLKRFMIFNPKDGQSEGCEFDKLLYHWTKDVPNNKIELVQQIDDICLCDATIAASIRLNGDTFKSSVQPDINRLPNSTVTSRNHNHRTLTLTFESTIILIVEVEHEQSIWIAVHVGPSISTDRNCDANTTVQQQSFDTNSIPLGAIERIVNNIYTRFCMINGTFQMIADNALKEGEIDIGSDDDHDSSEKLRLTKIRTKIRSICEDYFNSILQEIHLNSILSNIAALYNYIIYLDLNPLILMKVNSFINHLVCIDATQIRHTIALFNEQLLWSSLDMYDSRLIYNYLVSVLIRDALQEELSKETDKVRKIKENMAVYLRDVPDEINNLEEGVMGSSISGSQQSSYTSNKKLSKLYMTVFRSNNNMTLALIFKDADQFDLIHKCEHILTTDSRLGVIPLASLAQTVGHCFLKANSTSLNASTSQGGSSQQITGPNKRWQMVPSISKGPTALNDQKYLSLDRLNVSVNYSLNLEAPNKEQHLVIGSSDSNSPEMHAGNKKVRLIRNLLKLEPEFVDLKRRTGCQVEEFFGKTTSDTWLNVTNSKWKTIYSVYKMRNAGLNDAQQCAMSLRTALVEQSRY